LAFVALLVSIAQGLKENLEEKLDNTAKQGKG